MATKIPGQLLSLFPVVDIQVLPLIMKELMWLKKSQMLELLRFC